jgi:hypothetical protein
MTKLNQEGLTYGEFLSAAGVNLESTNIRLKDYPDTRLQKAWRNGTDPSEFRSEMVKRYRNVYDGPEKFPLTIDHVKAGTIITNKGSSNFMKLLEVSFSSVEESKHGPWFYGTIIVCKTGLTKKIYERVLDYMVVPEPEKYIKWHKYDFDPKVFDSE